jgi:UDP-GlcNAc:undecaprenyl-phosphate/decaprenyl-phosphate GlcNAc-1-phosphate transferase
MLNNAYLLAFAIAFIGCVLATPLVTRLATWAGAIDRPDQFRRIHKGAIPRLGGLGIALGLALGIPAVVAMGYLREPLGIDLASWWLRHWPVVFASAIVLAIGAVDDTRGMRPRVKLLGQAAAVLVLVLGGIQIQQVAILGWNIDLSGPALSLPMPPGVQAVRVSLPGLVVTMLWFLGCMNIWNLIDGMDGLASGVGLLVSATMMLVAIYQANIGSALLAAALAGSLAGFLLYNWHPACIFLGDSGSLLIGLLIGVIGVQDSMKGPSAVSILFPILAMGLPISDTAMAIFRRWVRHLPLSSADRRHVHHLLIGMGMNPRQAALCLYCFAAGLCGVVLLGVKLHNEFLALILGASGCLAFLLILTSRRDELRQLQADLRARFARGRQERFAAKATWDAIQKIELCDDQERIWELMLETSQALGCDVLRMTCHRHGRTVLQRSSEPSGPPGAWPQVSGPTATFRLPSGQDLLLTVSLHLPSESQMAADIAFRFLQKLALATAERLERLLSQAAASKGAAMTTLAPEALGASELLPPQDLTKATPEIALAPSPAIRMPLGWLRWALGGGDAAPVAGRSWADD